MNNKNNWKIVCQNLELRRLNQFLFKKFKLNRNKMNKNGIFKLCNLKNKIKATKKKIKSKKVNKVNKKKQRKNQNHILNLKCLNKLIALLHNYQQYLKSDIIKNYKFKIIKENQKNS